MSADQDKDREYPLEAAKQKLSEARGRPFDVDKILASERAKADRKRKAAKEAQTKLEETLRKARERRHFVREQKPESEYKSLEEAKLKANRKEAKEVKRPAEFKKKELREGAE